MPDLHFYAVLDSERTGYATTNAKLTYWLSIKHILGVEGNVAPRIIWS